MDDPVCLLAVQGAGKSLPGPHSLQTLCQPVCAPHNLVSRCCPHQQLVALRTASDTAEPCFSHFWDYGEHGPSLSCRAQGLWLPLCRTDSLAGCMKSPLFCGRGVDSEARGTGCWCWVVGLEYWMVCSDTSAGYWMLGSYTSAGCWTLSTGDGCWS
jgi:hypothetical protein